MTTRQVVVAGDVMMDWNLATTARAEIEATFPTGFDSLVARCQPGGAALLGDLIKRIADEISVGGPAIQVAQPTSSLPPEWPSEWPYHHSYATWSRYPVELGKSGDHRVWRVDSCLGVDPRPIKGPSGAASYEEGPVADTGWPDRDLATVDLLVLDDANFGFRDQTTVPASVDDPYPWVLLKMARPVAQGPLWERLFARPEKLVVVMAIHDLRAADVQISRGLSWEQTAQDLVSELTYNPVLNALSQCKYVVVSFDTSGAIALHPPDKPSPKPFVAKLFFDPETLEGDWVRRYPGEMVGYTTSLVAGLAYQLMRNSDGPTIAELELGVQRGLAAMRALHLHGYEEADDENKPDDRAAADRSDAAAPRDAATPTNAADELKPPRPLLRYPMQVIGAEVAKAEVAKAEVADTKPPFATAEIEHPLNWRRRPRPDDPAPPMPESWTILRAGYEGRNFNTVAADIVRDGIEHVLHDVPRGTFGELVTVDRQEIEGFRSIASLILEYDSRAKNKRPLNVAVFGPPGSGKSWSIVEVVKSVLPDRIEKLTFNLSQLNDPSALIAAFHQVRDKVLDGKLPLVFWDEFDTALADQKLGWLRYFLAPMQDGTFQDGQLTHAIGPAIFVFAGGTAERMEDFAPDEPTSEPKAPAEPQEAATEIDEARPKAKQARKRYAEFRALKGPDFVSRLKGFVNILGPNRRRDQPDPYFRIRRAIVLRSMLLREQRQLFHAVRAKGDKKARDVASIDPGVLRAFIETRLYRHGARSLESIVAMSSLSGATRYQRSALPAQAQLEGHVDASNFLGLVRRLEFYGPLLDQLAEWVHVAYCLQQLQEGYEWGEDDDRYLREFEPPLALPARIILRGEGGKQNKELRPFRELDDHYQEQNRGNVRDVPNKLAAVGYAIRRVPKPDEAPPRPPGLDAVVEFLAEMEHDRWMMGKLEAGWRWGPMKVDARRENPAILPWEPLTKAQLAERYGEEFVERIGNPELSDEENVLPDDEKEKDRFLTEGIPGFLEKAGYAIVKIEDDAGAIPDG